MVALIGLLSLLDCMIGVPLLHNLTTCRAGTGWCHWASPSSAAQVTSGRTAPCATSLPLLASYGSIVSLADSSAFSEAERRRENGLKPRRGDPRPSGARVERERR